MGQVSDRQRRRMLGEEDTAPLMDHLPTHGQDEVATKGDLAVLREVLDARITAEIATVRGEIAALRAEVAEKIGDVRGEIAALRAEVAEQIGDVRGEIATLRGEIATLRGEMAKQTRVFVVAIVAAVVAVAGLDVGSALLMR